MAKALVSFVNVVRAFFFSRFLSMLAIRWLKCYYTDQQYFFKVNA